MMEAKIRKPAVAGSFYADDAKELRQDCLLYTSPSPRD